MCIILGIETSCDETAAAVYDFKNRRLLSNEVFSQIKLHEIYGGVVPEIASRSHLEKIDIIIQQALNKSNKNLEKIDYIAVTTTPGLVGSLLIGICFAKALVYAKNKKIIAVNHLEGHVFSSCLKDDFSTINVEFPHISLLVSGGNSAFYLVDDFGKYKVIGQTLDDAAGEAFDKIAKIIGFGYPGGAKIEQAAAEVGFKDFFHYPRLKNINKDLNLSFSGLKTAVLYDLVKRNAYNLQDGPVWENLTMELQNKVSSSLLVCIGDIFETKLKLAFKLYPGVKAFTFVGGVACNKYLVKRLQGICQKYNKRFISPPCKFCGDNAAMIAFVAGYKSYKNEFSPLTLDVLK
ncbi:tRNA (adenosine(37)-N6)-threonylcarbamoyltransferase complex transferase subunit TsaD [Candidatus Dependentiae bacterium]|nr:tRNA (adenosine(37)-N6)-threonylcarbamoyltransferase complex transferase subunit TsaD [Candidatus Dependentiae bacterium]